MRFQLNALSRDRNLEVVIGMRFLYLLVEMHAVVRGADGVFAYALMRVANAPSLQ